MKPPFPSFTKEWHNDTYPALDPKDKASDKTVVITGASGGVGKGLAISFAKAGAKHLALLGRRKEALEETKSAVEAVHKSIQITIHIASSTDSSALETAASEIGKWDILILHAGAIPSEPKKMTDPDLDIKNWWSVQETNILGPLLTIRAFLPTAGSVVLSTSALLPFSHAAPPWAVSSAYNCSKVGALQLMHHLAAERKDLRVISIHPGVIPTAMSKGLENNKFMREKGMIDSVELASDFFVWAATTKEVEFLNGRFVCANWDVEELVKRKGEIEGTEMLKLMPAGWPFA